MMSLIWHSMAPCNRNRRMRHREFRRCRTTPLGGGTRTRTSEVNRTDIGQEFRRTHFRLVLRLDDSAIRIRFGLNLLRHSTLPRTRERLLIERRAALCVGTRAAVTRSARERSVCTSIARRRDRSFRFTSISDFAEQTNRLRFPVGVFLLRSSGMVILFARAWRRRRRRVLVSLQRGYDCTVLAVGWDTVGARTEIHNARIHRQSVRGRSSVAWHERVLWYGRRH